MMKEPRNPEELNDLRAEARRLQFVGRYEDALELHVWYHDHALEIDPAHSGVRVSFALREWMQLGDVFPTALGRLREIRESKAARLRGGETDPDLFGDVAAIDHQFGATAPTVDLFRELAGRDVTFGAQIYDHAAEALDIAQAFELAGQYIVDWRSRLQWAACNYHDGIAFADSLPRPESSRLAHEQIFTSDARRLIRILHGIGRIEEAREAREAACKEIDAPEIRNAMPS